MPPSRVITPFVMAHTDGATWVYPARLAFCVAQGSGLIPVFVRSGLAAVPLGHALLCCFPLFWRRASPRLLAQIGEQIAQFGEGFALACACILHGGPPIRAFAGPHPPQAQQIGQVIMLDHGHPPRYNIADPSQPYLS